LLFTLWACRSSDQPRGELFETLPDGRRAWRTDYALGEALVLQGTELDGRWLALDFGAAPFPRLLAPEWRSPDGTQPLWKPNFSPEAGVVEQRYEARPGVSLVRRAELVPGPPQAPTALRFSGFAEGSAAVELSAVELTRLGLAWTCTLDPAGAWQLHLPAVWAGALDQAPALVVGTPLDFSQSRSPLALLSGEAATGARQRYWPKGPPAAPGAPPAAAEPSTTRLLVRLSGHDRQLELWSDAAWLDVELLSGESPALVLEPGWPGDWPGPRSSLWLLR
jgi:hypothetical protein